MTVSISGTSGIVNDATDLNYTGTLTGGTGVVNLGSGQVYKDASGNVGIGVVPSASWGTYKVIQLGEQAVLSGYATGAGVLNIGANFYWDGSGYKYLTTNPATLYQQNAGAHNWRVAASGTAGAAISFSAAMTLDSSGRLLVGTTTTATSNTGIRLLGSLGIGEFTAASDLLLTLNRLNNDGTLISFRQDTNEEGSISVSGTTVSYNGGHLSRWAQMLTKPDLLKGTVMSNLDEMNVYTNADGNPVDNEQLNKVKVSDVEGDANVAGVFVNWDYDKAHNVDEINMAMTGDMIIRIAQGTTVARGDLLMSAGDGTAKPQGDDIVRSKTVAKVTSTQVTCIYADGSFCVPCVLMAC